MKELTDVFVKLPSLRRDHMFDHNIMTFEYDPSNFAIGEGFVNDLERERGRERQIPQ